MPKVTGARVKKALLKRVISKTGVYLFYLFCPLILHFLLANLSSQSHMLRMSFYSLCCILIVLVIDRPVHMVIKQIRHFNRNPIFSYASAFRFYCFFGFPFMILIDYEFYYFTYGPIIICIFAMNYFAEALVEYGEINNVPDEEILDYFDIPKSQPGNTSDLPYNRDSKA
jgi:hypothetical protein